MRSVFLGALFVVVGLVLRPTGGVAAAQPTAPDTIRYRVAAAGFAGLRIPPHADVLPAGEVTLMSGYTTPPGPEGEDGQGGSGNQTYLGGIGWGVADRLTLLLAIGINDDPIHVPVRGIRYPQSHTALALGGRFLARDWGRTSFGVQVSAEFVGVTSSPGLFNTGEVRDRTAFPAFAIDLPLTLRPTPRVKATLTPSVAHLPDRVMGAQYFGTVARLGARVDMQVSDRWTLLGSAELPMGGGTSTLDRHGRLRRLPTWRAGLLLHGSERVALVGSVTNAAAGTAATRHLTQLGAPVTLYTVGVRYAPTSREPARVEATTPGAPLETLGGITVPSPGTVPTARGRIDVTVDSKGAAGVRLVSGFARRFQFEILTARIRGPDPQAALEAPVGDGIQYRFGPQLQILDQSEGAPLSLAGRMTVGRDADDQQGYLLVEGIVEHSVGSRSHITLNPVAIQSGGRSLLSAGGSVDHALGTLRLISEARASFSGEPTVWAFGIRHNLLDRFTGDVFLTNAGGTLGLGRLLADPGGARVGLTVRAAL